MTLLKLEYFFVVAGVYLAFTALQAARDAAHPTRWGSALFWGVLALLFIAGGVLPSVVTGGLVVLLVVVAAMGQVSAPGKGTGGTAADGPSDLSSRGSTAGSRATPGSTAGAGKMSSRGLTSGSSGAGHASARQRFLDPAVKPRDDGGEGGAAAFDPAVRQRAAHAARLGNRLLAPALAIPLLVLVGSFLFERLRIGDFALVEDGRATQVALGVATIAGLALALRVTRAGPGEAVHEGGGLIQVMGWTLILPQMLAALGGIFGAAGVGEAVAALVAQVLPVALPLVAVIAYCVAMTLFTIIMGNAFAAFPVVTLGIGLPFIVDAHGGNPAIMGALGMLSGYCGTLVTPMAANFNLVPALLLELADRNAVIKAQVPMAVAIWLFNAALMAVCVYRF